MASVLDRCPALRCKYTNIYVHVQAMKVKNLLIEL